MLPAEGSHVFSGQTWFPHSDGSSISDFCRRIQVTLACLSSGHTEHQAVCLPDRCISRVHDKPHVSPPSLLCSTGDLSGFWLPGSHTAAFYVVRRRSHHLQRYSHIPSAFSGNPPRELSKNSQVPHAGVSCGFLCCQGQESDGFASVGMDGGFLRIPSAGRFCTLSRLPARCPPPQQFLLSQFVHQAFAELICR